MRVFSSAFRALLAAALLCAVFGCISSGDQSMSRRFPTPRDYPPETMVRVAFTGGGPEAWRLTGLATPPEGEGPLVLVVTGSPSWADFWAPTLALASAQNRLLLVPNRPGFASSEPQAAVTDIAKQAQALGGLIASAGRPVILVGQSYGGPIAVLLAAAHPDRVAGLVIVSGFFGEAGPTLKRLRFYGTLATPFIGRDLRNSLAEVRGQRPQLAAVRDMAARLEIPVTVLHGDRDDFIPEPSARRTAALFANTEYRLTAGDHFLNAGAEQEILAAVDSVAARAGLLAPAS